MAVVFDANATADTTANGVTSITASNLTVGSGSNRALIVQLGLSLHGTASRTVTWDFGGSAQPCALVTGASADSTGTNARGELWSLVNPVSGAKTLKAAWTGASDVCINGVSWTGVDQTGGATSFPHGTSAASAVNNTPGVTVTSATGNATMEQSVNDFGAMSGQSQTSTYLDNAPNLIGAEGQRAAGAASVSFGSVVSGTPGTWVAVGCDIVAFVAGGAAPFTPPTLDVPIRRRSTIPDLWPNLLNTALSGAGAVPFYQPDYPVPERPYKQPVGFNYESFALRNAPVAAPFALGFFDLPRRPVYPVALRDCASWGNDVNGVPFVLSSATVRRTGTRVFDVGEPGQALVLLGTTTAGTPIYAIQAGLGNL